VSRRYANYSRNLALINSPVSNPSNVSAISRSMIVRQALAPPDTSIAAPGCDLFSVTRPNPERIAIR